MHRWTLILRQNRGARYMLWPKCSAGDPNQMPVSEKTKTVADGAPKYVEPNGASYREKAPLSRRKNFQIRQRLVPELRHLRAETERSTMRR